MLIYVLTIDDEPRERPPALLAPNLYGTEADAKLAAQGHEGGDPAPLLEWTTSPPGCWGASGHRADYRVTAREVPTAVYVLTWFSTDDDNDSNQRERRESALEAPAAFASLVAACAAAQQGFAEDWLAQQEDADDATRAPAPRLVWDGTPERGLSAYDEELTVTYRVTAVPVQR